jgi:hypothetical protein
VRARRGGGTAHGAVGRTPGKKGALARDTRCWPGPRSAQAFDNQPPPALAARRAAPSERQIRHSTAVPHATSRGEWVSTVRAMSRRVSRVHTGCTAASLLAVTAPLSCKERSLRRPTRTHVSHLPPPTHTHTLRERPRVPQGATMVSQTTGKPRCAVGPWSQPTSATVERSCAPPSAPDSPPPRAPLWATARRPDECGRRPDPCRAAASPDRAGRPPRPATTGAPE